MESYAHFNLQPIDTNQRGAHFDHREDNADGAEKSLGWYDVRDPPHEIQDLDSGIQ